MQGAVQRAVQGWRAAISPIGEVGPTFHLFHAASSSLCATMSVSGMKRPPKTLSPKFHLSACFLRSASSLPLLVTRSYFLEPPAPTLSGPPERSLTQRPTAATPPVESSLTILEPTTQPSANSPNSSTCAREVMPKPDPRRERRRDTAGHGRHPSRPRAGALRPRARAAHGHRPRPRGKGRSRVDSKLQVTDDNGQIVPLGTELDGSVADGLDDAFALGDTQALHLCLLLVAHPRRAQQRHHVHHARDWVECRLGRLRDALSAARRRGERHEAEVVGSSGRRHDAPRLLAWKVDDDEAVHAGRLGRLARLLDAGGEEGVVVAHHQHGDGEALGARLLAVLEHVLVLHAVLERDDARSLNDGAIGHGVGEWHAELDDVAAIFLHLE